MSIEYIQLNLISNTDIDIILKKTKRRKKKTRVQKIDDWKWEYIKEVIIMIYEANDKLVPSFLLEDNGIAPSRAKAPFFWDIIDRYNRVWHGEFKNKDKSDYVIKDLEKYGFFQSQFQGQKNRKIIKGSINNNYYIPASFE